jgi:hypothetical protein
MVFKSALSFGAAAALALALGGCGMMGNSGPASANTVGGNAPSAAGGASGAGTQDGPSGGTGSGAGGATSPAP